MLKGSDVFRAPGGLGMIKMMIFTLGSSPGLSKDSNPTQAALIGFRQLDYLSDFNCHNLPAGLNRYNGSQMLYLELPWHQRQSCFFFVFFYQRINIWKNSINYAKIYFVTTRALLTCCRIPQGWYETLHFLMLYKEIILQAQFCSTAFCVLAREKAFSATDTSQALIRGVSGAWTRPCW